MTIGKSTLSERSKKRRAHMTIQKMDLHALEHHSLNLEIDSDSASRLIFDMSMQHYIDTTGQTPSQHVDKSHIRIINLKER